MTRIATFGELVSAETLEIGDGYRAKNQELGGTGLIFLRAAYLQDAGFVMDQPDRFLTNAVADFGPKITQLGDVVITTKGNSTGRVGRIREPQVGSVYSPHLSYWRSRRRDEIDQSFLFYWSQSPEFRSQLAGMASSTDMAPYLSLRDQMRLRISLPQVEDQVAIASILGAIDDKIDLNRRMNATLETMAGAIFKDRFVDFGPTRAKVEGRAPYLAPDIWALFPDRLDDERKPKGWQNVSLGEITTRITKGTTPTTDEIGSGLPHDQSINFVKVNALTNDGRIIWEKLDQVPHSVHAGILRRSILQNEDILYSIAGTIGRIAFVDNDLLPANTNQALAIIRANTECVPSRFLLMLLRQRDFMATLHKKIVHAVQANLSLSMISSALCLLPPVDVLAATFAPIEIVIRLIESNNRETRTLATTRDLLLPKLMSGEVQLREAERVLEAVA
jgi:type I restriction enzyme, S subunit